MSIFKNYEVRGGVTLTLPLRRISWQRGLRGIGLRSKVCVVCGGILSFQMCIKFYSHLIFISTSFKTVVIYMSKNMY